MGARPAATGATNTGDVGALLVRALVSAWPAVGEVSASWPTKLLRCGSGTGVATEGTGSARTDINHQILDPERLDEGLLSPATRWAMLLFLRFLLGQFSTLRLQLVYGFLELLHELIHLGYGLRFQCRVNGLLLRLQLGKLLPQLLLQRT